VSKALETKAILTYTYFWRTEFYIYLMLKTNVRFYEQLTELLKPLERECPQKLKLIIHVGTPKTGTTSLQAYLDKKRRKLRGKGFSTLIILRK